MSTQPTKHLELETHYHNGIGVRVEIDYDNGTISLLNNDGKAKQWVFAKRHIEYIAGWQNILDAMKHAIDVSEMKLEKHQKAREKALQRKEIDLHLAIAAENKKNRV